MEIHMRREGRKGGNMPTQIDCPECDRSLSKDQQFTKQLDKDCESGLFCETTCEDCDHLPEKPGPCKACNDTGKIAVYTEAEMQKAVKDERKACAELTRAWELIGRVGGGCADAIMERGNT